MSNFRGRDDHLRRLPPEYYQGQAYVHWSMTIEGRKTGWLSSAWHCGFREVLSHCCFRYGITCPLYCCMPDHIHLLWVGILDTSDQLKAAKYFRKHVNRILSTSNSRFQREAYDHVLREDQRERSAFENTAEYIARNPERAGLVGIDCFCNWPFSQCLVPGYPELSPWQPDYWERFWRTYFYLRRNGLVCGGSE